MKIRTTKQELQRIIREEKMALLLEVTMGEIQNLNGKEVSMRYRKATGEVKTYFGRIVASPKAGPDKFFMGVLNQGLKLFKVSGVTAISPASLREEFKEYFDEMCSKEECEKFMNEVAPSGWEGTVKHMKKHSDVSNPWALANWMKSKGYKSHHFASGKHKADYSKHESVEPDDAELINKAPGQGAKDWYEESTCPDCNGKGCPECNWAGSDKEDSRGNPRMKEDKKWIQKAVNPAHKGYCTPMTKSTCTPRRKALAKRFKRGIEEADLTPREKYHKAVAIAAKKSGVVLSDKDRAMADRLFDKGNKNPENAVKMAQKFQNENLSPELQRFVASLEKKYGHDFIDKSTPEERSHYMKLAKIPGSGSAIDPKKKRVTEGHGDCPHCFGTGEDLDTGEPCSHCHGTGEKIGQEIKETPVPGEFVTANVQKVKKCPTCEGQPDLKIGCPTCAGTGRIKRQDKYMNERRRVR